MCRLFGMSGGPEPVRATFWLLEAPDSLRSRAAVSPTAPGSAALTPAARPVVDKQPLAAFEDQAFGEEAREVARARSSPTSATRPTGGPT